jgi:hypothetical protein
MSLFLPGMWMKDIIQFVKKAKIPDYSGTVKAKIWVQIESFVQKNIRIKTRWSSTIAHVRVLNYGQWYNLENKIERMHAQT